MQPTSVEALGSRAKRLANDLERALIEASQELQGLASTWTGPAGTAYLRGWREMHDGGIQVFAALRDLGNSVGVAAGTITRHDDATTTSLRGLS